jgi:hypothetical protein
VREELPNKNALKSLEAAMLMCCWFHCSGFLETRHANSAHAMANNVKETRGIRSCCNPPTSALKHKANEVEGAEDCGIGARFETREGLAIDDDDPRKAEVDLMTWSVLRI